MADWAIHPEQPGNAAAIASVITAAFRDHPHSDGCEAAIVSALREAGALTLSLVAEIDGTVVGHTAFSPVTISDGTGGWFGIGPVSVLPAHQRKGIGGAMIREGLDRLKHMGAAGCTVLGDPAYYARFGYTHDPGLTYPAPMPEAFQQLGLSGSAPKGEVRYHPAFG